MRKYPPTSKELREWMDEKGLSNKDVAKALRLSDGRVVRFWTAKKDPRPIPYPSWVHAAPQVPQAQSASQGAREAGASEEDQAGDARAGRRTQPWLTSRWRRRHAASICG